jgi:3-hydroxyisobutyrate dehydrogenase-like beta-hydroxyacid dehydrogenase
MRIGWIGLGAIGTQMAKRVLAAGHSVTVYARGSGLAELEAAGAQVSQDYKALASGCDLLGLCLFSDAQVREVLFDEGTLAALPAGSILMNHTTGSPDLAREIAERAPAGADVLDATFSGGPREVEVGTLTVMTGGTAEVVESAAPVLQSYASSIHHVGEVGQAQRLKLLNNLLFATNVMNAAETLALAERHGFDASVVGKVLQECSAASFGLKLFDKPVPPSAVLAALRPYLAKDVGTAIESLNEGGEGSLFARTATFFRQDG